MVLPWLVVVWNKVHDVVAFSQSFATYTHLGSFVQLQLKKLPRNSRFSKVTNWCADEISKYGTCTCMKLTGQDGWCKYIDCSPSTNYVALNEKDWACRVIHRGRVNNPAAVADVNATRGPSFVNVEGNAAYQLTLTGTSADGIHVSCSMTVAVSTQVCNNAACSELIK